MIHKYIKIRLISLRMSYIWSKSKIKSLSDTNTYTHNLKKTKKNVRKSYCGLKQSKNVLGKLKWSV